jgi:hypothetical protein
MRKTRSKLLLERQTLKNLSTEHLESAAGGTQIVLPPTSLQPKQTTDCARTWNCDRGTIVTKLQNGCTGSDSICPSGNGFKIG